jgi:TPR repeat protein
LLLAAACVLVGTTALADPLKDADRAVQRQDYTTAINILRPLAEKGDADAQWNLAFIYIQGEGVSQDYAEALRLLRLSAAQGNPSGQAILGGLYFGGNGVAQDNIEALRLFRLSAEQGNALGELSLGYMYEQGNGVTKDSVRAYMWFQFAASQKLDNAIQARSDIDSFMSVQDIATAKDMAARCEASHYKDCDE